jgi:hypothetical protein
VSYLSKLKLPIRIGIFSAEVALAYIATPILFWRLSGNSQIQRLCVGSPVWKEKAQVLELDKLFFHLDDDNKYEPTLWHHGLSKVPTGWHEYKADE